MIILFRGLFFLGGIIFLNINSGPELGLVRFGKSFVHLWWEWVTNIDSVHKNVQTLLQCLENN